TAVLCQNNSMVQSLMNFLQKIHLKPYDDVSFLSFEDSELAEKTRLTCVSYDRRKIGEEAAKLCLKMMKGGKKENIVIPSKIVGRDSVRVINREKRTEE
ncbi:MAG: substrate-binding domain-containing protein, partial [Firmicutes bacterium]|nr:substrate-binding domain-containing protein [Bacillota bacterium]